MNYSKYKTIAKNKLSKYGTDCVIIRKSGERYNAETNEYENETTEIQGKCLVSSYNAQNIDGTNIKSGDLKIMAVLDSEPKTGDVIKISDKVYSVISWTEQNPNKDEAIFYTIQGR